MPFDFCTIFPPAKCYATFTVPLYYRTGIRATPNRQIRIYTGWSMAENVETTIRGRHLHLTDRVIQALRDAAKNERRSMSALAEELIAAGLRDRQTRRVTERLIERAS